VVPFYNVGEYIGDCLESIARQTWTDFEAILVDDGSPDDSAVVAKEICSRDDRFRIVEQENAGLGPARNRGVREATGEEPRELRVLTTDEGLVAFVTLRLDSATPLAEAHARASEVEERIRRATPGIADVIVHTEP